MLIGLASLTLLFSCKKILDPDIIELPTAENAISSQADVEKAIAGAYAYLRAVVPDKAFLMSDVRSNTFSSYSQSSNTRPETAIATNSASSLLNNGGGNWNGFYTAIAQCNLVLDEIPSVTSYDAATKRRHIGEASFIRALSYFYLVRFWGDVPLNLKPVDIGNMGKAPQKDVLAQIKTDLDAAISNLDLDYGANDRNVRATKGAAWAIKAHVLGWQQDFAGCEKMCDSVITRGLYRLVTDTSNLISIFYGKSSEGIFELNFDAGLRELQKNRVYNRTLGMPWYKDQSDGGGGTDRFILSPSREQLNRMFVPDRRDARLFTWFDKATYYKGAGPSNEDRVFLGKYKSLQLKGDTSSQNINESNILITRLADIMLLRAEALAHPSVGRAADAAIWLNKVRDRAYAAQYAGGGDIQDTILAERRKELIGEGHYFFDLVRTRKMPKDSKIVAADWYEKGAWLLPIDQTIIAKSNFMITQNEFWR